MSPQNHIFLSLRFKLINLMNFWWPFIKRTTLKVQSIVFCIRNQNFYNLDFYYLLVGRLANILKYLYWNFRRALKKTFSIDFWYHQFLAFIKLSLNKKKTHEEPEAFQNGKQQVFISCVLHLCGALIAFQEWERLVYIPYSYVLRSIAMCAHVTVNVCWLFGWYVCCALHT